MSICDVTRQRISNRKISRRMPCVVLGASELGTMRKTWCVPYYWGLTECHECLTPLVLDYSLGLRIQVINQVLPTNPAQSVW